MLTYRYRQKRSVTLQQQAMSQHHVLRCGNPITFASNRSDQKNQRALLFSICGHIKPSPKRPYALYRLDLVSAFGHQGREPYPQPGAL